MLSTDEAAGGVASSCGSAKRSCAAGHGWCKAKHFMLGTCSFAAAAGLAMKLEGHPQKRAILDALERRRLGPLDAFFENFLTELAVTGACSGRA